jgi:hypothetical protein
VLLQSVKSAPANTPRQKSSAALRIFLSSPLILLVFLAFGLRPCCGMTPQEQAAALPPQQMLKATGAILPAIEPSVKEAATASPVIVIGFLGGHVKKGNVIHREVQLAMHLRQNHPVGVYAQVFQNSHGEKAFKQILRLLDTNHDGAVSVAEKQHARIILYGHSWGASETVTMAHQLQDDKIPVLLTILVDRVSKIGAGDPRIPANVAQAVNFYQLNGLLHGRPTIRAADSARTQILGNYQLDYDKTHVSCDKYPWYARLFMGPHIEIENDPRVWNRVESLISAKLPPEEAATTASLTNPSE